MDYGNKVVGNDIKNFWVDESLKINTFEQIKFLKKLYKNDLPFKQKDIDTLKNIMIDEKNDNYTIRAKSGWTDIFIYPGYQFKIVDAIITNFHLPKSTLLMLISAFAGKEKILQAYQEAIKEKYQFFSFGDAMFLNNQK